MPKKGYSTQTLVNTFPLWANIRVDEQSLGYQFMNVVGLRLDDLRKQNLRIGDNYFLPTSIVSDIDLFYAFKLPGSYEFTKEEGDDSGLIFTPPTVSGIVDSNIYNVVVAGDNNTEDFWYNAIPDRLSLEETVSGDFLIASGYVNQSPLDVLTPSGIINPPNKLSITTAGGVSYLGVEENSLIRKSIVQVEGTTRAGAEVAEEIIFLHDDTLQTIHDYSYVNASGVKIYGINDADETFVTVNAANFNRSDYKVAYELANAETGDAIPLFWALGSGVSPDQHTLDLVKYDIDDLELRMDGFVTKHPFLQQELLDTAGSGVLLEDIAVEPNSDRIWAVSSGVLYLYDSDLPYPDTTPLLQKDYDAMAVIEPNTLYPVLGEEIELDYIWKRPVTGIVSHRVSVEKPDGNKYSIEDGVEVTYHTDNSSWIFGEPQGRHLRTPDFFTPDQRGQYTYTLEVNYTDETSSVDKRVIAVSSKRANAQFTLSEAGIARPAVGVDFDSEYKMWILDNAGNRHQINMHYDIMIIDFNKKYLYFREKYNRIRIYE